MTLFPIDVHSSHKSGVLILVTPPLLHKAKEVLNSEFGAGWESCDRICLEIVECTHIHNALEISKKIETAVIRRPNIYFNVYIYGSTTEKHLIRADHNSYEIRQSTGDERTFHRGVTRCLDDIGLHWKRRLESFSHEKSHAEEDIDNWIKQWRHLGEDKQEIGTAILKSLDPWSVERIKQEFQLSRETASAYDRICVISRVGEGAGVIIHPIKKWLDEIEGTTCKVEGFEDAISNPNVRSILCLEDSLFTATELEKNLIALRDQISTPEFRRKEIQFRYAIQTDLGRRTFEAVISGLGLTDNIQISTTGKQIQVLTSEGLSAFEDGVFYEHGCSRPFYDQMIQNRRKFIQTPTYSKDDTLQKALISDASKLGRQLVDLHFRRKQRPLSNTKLEEFVLGARNLGLNIVFEYGIPKASLPVLWAHGEIQYGKKSRRRFWRCLFPRSRGQS